MVIIEVAFSTPSGVGRGAAAAARNPGRFFRVEEGKSSSHFAAGRPLQPASTTHNQTTPTAHLPNLSYAYYRIAFLDRHFYHIVLS